MNGIDFMKSIGYNNHEIQLINEYNDPTVLEQNVHSQLAPKMRYIIESLQGGYGES